MFVKRTYWWILRRLDVTWKRGPALFSQAALGGSTVKSELLKSFVPLVSFLFSLLV